MHLDQIELMAQDLVATKAFYHDTFGLPVLASSEEQLLLAAGSSRLRFLNSNTPSFYHVAFLIPGNQVEAALQWVRARTHVLPFNDNGPIADFRNWNAYAFYFHDNNGNILEFIAHHDLPYTSAEPFSAASLICICEIGIPVPSVPDACRFFKEHYQVPHYVKGPNLPDFAVMGEEDSLLIITEIGRGWLPTQRPAAPHYLQLTFTHNGHTTCLRNEDLPH